MVRKANNELHAERILKGRKEMKTTALNAVAMVIRQLSAYMMGMVTTFNEYGCQQRKENRTMNIINLAKKLTECCEELEKIGACGGFVMDDRNVDGKTVISVQMSSENLNKLVGGKPYYTPFSKDEVMKHVTIGKADFYALVAKEKALKEMFA